jgi:uncharacterized protein (DUF1697 family)
MQYIAMLRGINVSGQKKISMADLRSLCTSIGLQNVQTYIQTGNILFTASITNKEALKTMIQQAIYKQYKFHVPVQLRSSDELASIIKNCPFNTVGNITDGTKLLLSFLSATPEHSAISKIQDYVVAPEKLVVNADVIYLYCPNGYGRSKLSNNFLESKLNIIATTRNWKSVCKLYELSQ